MDESVRRRLLNVLRRATDDDPAARYATVIEFWSDLAQVVSVEEEKKTDEVYDSDDDATIIRPRLNVAPGTLPNVPSQPDFDPALASAGLHAKFTTATLFEMAPDIQPVAKERALEANVLEANVLEANALEANVLEANALEANALEANDLHQAQPAPQPQPKPKSKSGDRSSKFFIELQENRPAPAVQTQVKGEPLAKAGNQEPAKAKAGDQEPAKAKKSSAKRAKKATEKFSRKIRRNIFTGLLVFTLLGAMVSVNNYVRKQNEPIGFGPPTEIEILAEGLNVRSEPSTLRGDVLGWVAKGSKHHVLQQPDKNWIKIQINPSHWSKKELGVDADSGWIFGDLDGNPPKVKVISRKFWR
jgi:hypothetical protein